jgi:hypothetical protein
MKVVHREFRDTKAKINVAREETNRRQCQRDVNMEIGNEKWRQSLKTSRGEEREEKPGRSGQNTEEAQIQQRKQNVTYPSCLDGPALSRLNAVGLPASTWGWRLLRSPPSPPKERPDTPNVYGEEDA